MDISEIWDNLGYLAAPLVAFFLFHFARRIPREWLRIPVRFVCVLLIMIAVLALAAEGCWVLCWTTRRPAIVSPDGRHVALACWTGVIFDVNYVAAAHVSVRSRFSPIATEVFADQVVARSLPDLLNDPEVRWLDDHRLLVSTGKSGQIKGCSPGPSGVAGIQILCQE
jgi:hypothetical protein